MTPVRINLHRAVRSAFAAFLALVVAIALAACWGSSGRVSQGSETGLSMQVERGSQALDIVRAAPGGTKPAGLDPDSWTVFVYLCGSDLESDDGAATTDLSEMVAAAGSDKVSFVVETGGANRWSSDDVDSNRTGRFLIRDGAITDVGSMAAANMGEADTLADFLTWGVANYPAEHMGLILWNHGGGSISGVCFDERNDDDALVLRELDSALASTYATMWAPFEFVGFDACLMSTVETANVLATYANYMIASQEDEPNSGWEYSSIVEHLANNPATTGAELGKVICDAYLADNKSWSYVTLAVTDLSKVDDLLQSFYRFSQELYAASEDKAVLASIVRNIRDVDRFGSNNWLEGYANMVDLGGLAKACKGITPSSDDVLASLKAAVVYQATGDNHTSASGLSIYYPLSTGDADELKLFEAVSVNPSYIAFVDRLAHAATYGDEDYDDYSLDPGHGNNLWSWLLSDEDTEHWDYADEHDDQSSLITFAHKPQSDEDGYYWFQLDEQGLENTAMVSALVSELTSDGDLIALGETYDVDADWDTGTFYDCFDGSWLSLPDGQNLCIYVADWTDDYLVYTSPITLNDKECYLHIRQYYDDGRIVVEGVHDGMSEEGKPGRGITKLKKGDIIVPLFDAFALNTDEQITYEGDPYHMESKKLKLDYQPLYEGTYFYSFRIEDIYGDYYVTDPVEFDVDENGEVYFF